MLEIEPLNPPAQEGNDRPSFWQVLRWAIIVGVPLLGAFLFCLLAFAILVDNSKVNRETDIDTVSPIFRELVARELVDVSLMDLFFGVIGNFLVQNCKFMILTPSYSQATLSIRQAGTNTATYQDFVNSVQFYTHDLGLVFVNIDGTLQPMTILWLPDSTPADVKNNYRIRFNPVLLSKAPLSLYVVEIARPQDLLLQDVLQRFLQDTFTQSLSPGIWVYNQVNFFDYITTQKSSSSTLQNYLMELSENTTTTEIAPSSNEPGPVLINGKDMQEGLVNFVSSVLTGIKTKFLILEPDEYGLQSGKMRQFDRINNNYDTMMFNLLKANTTTLVGYNFEYESHIQGIIILWKPHLINKNILLKNQIFKLMERFDQKGFPLLVASNLSEMNKLNLLEIAVHNFFLPNTLQSRYELYNKGLLDSLKLFWCL